MNYDQENSWLHSVNAHDYTVSTSSSSSAKIFPHTYHKKVIIWIQQIFTNEINTDREEQAMGNNQ